jgi:hypothetical protein
MPMTVKSSQIANWAGFAVSPGTCRRTPRT